MGIVKDKRQPAAAELRRRAEERLNAQTPITTSTRGIGKGAQRLDHELDVHRIELEMQNEELRHSRNELETALEKYTVLYDFAPVGYLTLDRKGTIRSANLTGAGLMGVERSGLIGRRYLHFVPADARHIVSDFLEKVFTGQTKEVCEVALLKDGNSQFFMQIEAMADASGEECHIALIDITERKRADNVINKLNADLVARNSDLEKYNMELAAFNYMASHDLRQPLNNICTSSQAIELMCGDKLDDECMGLLQVIKNGARNMNNLIGAFLRFSNSEHAELHLKRVDLSDKAKVVAAGLRLTEPGRQVSFLIKEGLIVKGDPELLRVVIENLFGNAWKYTEHLEQATIEFGAMEIDGKPTYFIRDNGPGFDMREADKLFLPFKRLQGTIEFKGHGIGLSTVERIIRRHGGKIWAFAEPGKGATFFFTLPLN